MSDATINSTKRTDLVPNDHIGRSEIYNKNQEAKLFNGNEIEINNKNINTKNGQRQNTSIKHREDTVLPRTSKYRIILGPKEPEIYIISNMRTNLYH